MKNFKELEKKSTNEVEQSILSSWHGTQGIYEQTVEKNKDKECFVFYDGPAFANGFPGLHHMVAKNLKDTICKYHSMHGKKVVRKVGWDTHGLPIENHVEKKLGLKSKKEIEEYGIANFNQKCRESIRENEQAFVNLTEKMGQFIDTENPYLTYTNEYIETEWWILKKYFEEGLFYEGNRVMPYCPRCGTGLASHEVAQGYQDVSVDTVIVPMKLKEMDAYFLVWTTTPWTLLANVGLCVNPNESYVLAESKGLKFIVGEKLASKVLNEDYQVLETYQGKDLEYKEYEQLIKEINVTEKAFFVCCDEYVTMEDGTGIVHLAPAFGEDDARVGKKYNLPLINPVGKDGKYIEGLWKDTLVFDADVEIIKYLKTNDKLFKKQKITHNYPHCWRCQSPLLYYTLPSYYLAITKYKDKIIEANREVNWYPAYVGEKRFSNWLENLKDWAISRTRYWGCPIPYWTCECGHREMIGSIKELKEKSIEEIDEKTLDLHRPHIDSYHLKCEKCGGKMTRILDVLDCWFDSGSMPFAQYHYPFENKDFFETQFPADFISEGIDQTRGWFYTLLVISTFVKGCSPYKNVLVNDLLLDAEGKKMSKSRGNIVEPFSTIEKYGADTVRFYLPYVSPVWTPLKFNEEGLKEVYSKFINPLKNTYNFFAMYANTDNIDIDECDVEYEKREELDLWLLSKYNNLVKYVNESFLEYDLNKVVRAIAYFVSEDLSNWYIRRSRKRFWQKEKNNSKKSVYKTTYEVLEGLCKLIAPITPFISEEMYRNLTNEESVHFASYPECNNTLINDTLEQKMDQIRDIIRLGRNLREEVKIKVREPLESIYLDGRKESEVKEFIPLIKEELNIKKVIFIEDLSEYMNFRVLPNFKEVGKIFGSHMKEFQTILENLETEKIMNLEKGTSIEIKMNEETIIVTPNMVEIRVEAKEGFPVSMENNLFLILNTERTESLILEGIAREFVSKVQQLRKTKNLEVTDRIKIYYEGSDTFKKVLQNFEMYMKEETLAIEILLKENLETTYDLNGESVKIEIEKSNSEITK